MHIFRQTDTCKVEDGRTIVYVLYQFRNVAACIQPFGQVHNKRRVHGFFVHETLVEPTVFAHIKTLVRGINHQCIVQHIFLFQVIQYAPYIIVQRLNYFCIITHIALIFPFGEFFTFQVTFIKIFNDRRIKCVESFTVISVHTFYVAQIALFQWGVFALFQHLQVVNQVHILEYAHFLRSGGRAAFIIIIEVIGQRECLVFVEGKVFYFTQPVAMNGFMMNKKTERFFLVPPVFHPIDTHICN